MKNTIIVSGVYELFLKTKKELYLDAKDSYNLDLYLNVIQDRNQLEECMKIYKANKQRKYKGWNEILKWYYAILYIPAWKKYKMIFGTLTFSPDTLEKTNQKTRRKYVQRYLSEHTKHYQANIDFGKKNGREHYHFIAMVEKDLESKKWEYGTTWLSNIKLLDKKQLKRLKEYLLKLNNHTYKESTRQARILRDRNQDGLDYLIEELGKDKFHKFKLLINARE